MKFSDDVNKIIKRSEEISLKLKCDYIGTEHLLLALYESKDTICHFLLEEDDINMDILLKAYYSVIEEKEVNTKYTKNLEIIFEKAGALSTKFKSKYIYDEHLFYALIDTNCTARLILENLKIDTQRYKEDTIDIIDIEEDTKDQYPFLINLTKEASQNKYIPRNNYIERMIYILNKKQKHNPLLIGNPGVGKTALVEGLSKIINQPIYQLNIGKTISSTKYRGELEEKIIKTMDFIEQNDVILFIDEIHNIVNSNMSDSSIDIANIIKPYLTKPNILIIGATTLDEYHNYFSKDKAMVRRFQNIFIDEPNLHETKTILKGIIKDYEDYHKIKYSNKIIDEVIKMAHVYLPNKTFPDKAIDLLDELGSRKKIPLYNSLKEIIKDYTGIKSISLKKLNNIKLNYNAIKPYYEKIINLDLNKRNNVCVIKVNNRFDIEKIMSDLEEVFGLKKEALLLIDLENYLDNTMLNNLIGSSKGYVGYNEGGLLTEHIIRYPMSVVYFKNLHKTTYQIELFIRNLFLSNNMTDNKNRIINLTNTIFIYSSDSENSNVGLIKNELKKQEYYNVKINE